MATFARTALAVLVLLLAIAHDATAKPGDIDRRFGFGGLAQTERIDGGFAGAVQRDGRILVAGGISYPGVVRLTARGRRDRSFGSRGLARVVGHDDAQAFGIRRTASGIRVAAFTITTNVPPVELLRFSRGGNRPRRIVHDEHFPGPITAGVERRDGGAFVTSRNAVRAIDPDGRLDSDFAGGTISFGPPGPVGSPGIPRLLAVRPDGRLLVEVRRDEGTLTINQYTRQGTLDPSWGGDGRVTPPFDGGRLEVLRGGDVVTATGGARRLVRMARFSRSGRLRRSFGVGGIAGRIRTDAGGSVRDVAEDGRGRLYVLTESRRINVVAFTRSGRRILRFGRRGIRRLPRPARNRLLANDESRALLVAPRRRLVVVGSRFREGFGHPAFGCDFRGDGCATEVAAIVWRLKR